MPEVVFVSTLEPKDGRRDELVELLAELAKHIRGEPGYLQYSVHRPLGEDKGPLVVAVAGVSLVGWRHPPRRAPRAKPVLRSSLTAGQGDVSG
jgi:Antibiotic biosynthesis monooxygenase